MEGVDCFGGLQGQFEPPPPIRRAGVGVQNVVEGAVAHELDYEEAVVEGAIVGEAEEVD